MQKSPKHLLALLAVVAGTSAQAQVGFIADMMVIQLCTLNNWNEPVMHKRLKGASKADQNAYLASLNMPSSMEGKQCFIKNQPLPVDKCNQALETAKGKMPAVGGGMPLLSEEVSGSILEAISTSPAAEKCLAM